MRRAWFGFGMVLAGMGGTLFTYGLAFGQAIETDNEAAPAASSPADDYEICPYRRCHGFNPSRPYLVEETESADSGESIVPAANAEANIDWEWEVYQRWYEGRWYRDSFVLQAEEAPAESNLVENQAAPSEATEALPSDLAASEEGAVEYGDPAPVESAEVIPSQVDEIPSSEIPSGESLEAYPAPESTLPEQANTEPSYEASPEQSGEANPEQSEQGSPEQSEQASPEQGGEANFEPSEPAQPEAEQSEIPQAAEPKDIYSEEYYEDPAPTETPDFADESNEEPAPADTDGDDANDGEGQWWDGDSEEGDSEASDDGEDYVPADEGTEIPAEEPASEEGAAAPEAAQPQDIYSEEYRTDDFYRDGHPMPTEAAPMTEEAIPEVAPEAAPEAEAAPAEAIPGYQEDYVPDYGTESVPPVASEEAPSEQVEEALPTEQVEEALPTEQDDIQNRQTEEYLPEALPNEAPQLDSGIDGSFLQLRDVIGEMSVDTFAMGARWIQMHETCSALMSDAVVRGEELFRPLTESIRDQLAELLPQIRVAGVDAIDAVAAEVASDLGGDAAAGLVEGLEVTPFEPVVTMNAEELDVARRNMLLQMGESLDHFASLLGDISQQLINQAYAVPQPDLTTAGRSGDATR